MIKCNDNQTILEMHWTALDCTDKFYLHTVTEQIMSVLL